MNGDFSRLTFDKTKHYTGVLAQQGRVSLDADTNEQQAITQYRHDATAADVIGPSGVPKQGGGFAIGVSGDAKDLTIGAGTLYVDGLLCENEQTDVLLTNQPDLPLKQGNFGGFTLPTTAGRYLAYLDVWQRYVGALDDPQIKEVALGGPDTTTRLKTVWQVKLTTVGASDTCATFGADWRPVAKRTGMLAASTTSATTSANDPCVLPPTAGFRRLENQLYRIEIHRGGDRTQATFKWSRDNGTVATAITNMSGQTLTVQDVGRDSLLSFAPGQWAELIDDRLDLNDPDGSNMRGQLVQIDTVNHGTHAVVLKAVPSSLPLRPTIDGNAASHPKLRRWDQRGVGGGATGLDNGIPLPTGPLELEDGLQIEFTDGTYSAGDYWLVPARTAINDLSGGIEWPRDPATNQLLPQEPHGIAHHYSPLALVDFDATAQAFTLVSDCRKPFSSLVVVQETLDELARRQGSGSCTFTVAPEAGWERVFEQVADDGDAKICFAIGTYALTTPVVVRGKGHLTLSGCKQGTRIIAATAEAALVFENCRSVTVRDLYAETGVADAVKGQATARLNGTLTCLNCADVEMTHLALKCGAGTTRAATCITVRNDATKPRPARITHCDLLVGHEQTGMLLVNVSRATVEDNTVQVYAKPQRLAFDKLLQNARFRAGVRRLLITDVQTTPPSDTQGSKARVTLAAGGQNVFFMSDKTVAKSLQTLLTGTQGAAATPRALLAHTQRTLNRVLLDTAFRGTQPLLNNWFTALAAQNPAVAAQGIVIAGQVARDVRVCNNTIQDVLQGVRLGLSHARDPNNPTVETPDRAGTVVISGNTIELIFPPVAMRERFGVFVGNCDSLILENNYVRAQRFPQTGTSPLEGVRVFGFFGDRLIARHNHLADCTTGISVHVLNTSASVGARKLQWLVADNIAAGAGRAVVVVEPRVGLVRQIENYA